MDATEVLRYFQLFAVILLNHSQRLLDDQEVPVSTSADGSERCFRRHRATKRLKLRLQFPYTRVAHGRREVDMNVPAVRVVAYPLEEIRHFLYGKRGVGTPHDRGEVDDELVRVIGCGSNGHTPSVLTYTFHFKYYFANS